MESIKKECSLVLLPVRGKSKIWSDLKDSTKLAWYEWYQHASSGGVSYQLYVTSDDEIKEGDYYIEGNVVKIKTSPILIEGCRKIIATTDGMLKVTLLENEFIEEFVSNYNNGNLITKVSVEYTNEQQNYIDFDVLVKGEIYPKFIKTITAVKVKTSWNREEVEVLIKNFIKFYKEQHPELQYPLKGVGKWIKENL